MRKGVEQSGKTVLKLDLDVLTLSADRIHQAVARELKLPGSGQRRIHLLLHKANEEQQEIGVASVFYTDGWQYRVTVPDRIEPIQLVRGMVHVVLLEFANRRAGSKSAEIPLWLTEGLVMHLMNSVGPGLTVDSVSAGTMFRTTKSVQGAETLKGAREILLSERPLSFADLCRPTMLQLSEEELKLFQSSAQLFYTELIRLSGGRRNLITMLQSLPECWNWELAFLHAYGGHFAGLLDVEKWWSVVVTAFTGRDPAQTWTAGMSLEKLDEILLAQAQVRLATNTLPVRAEATLQQVIGDWEWSAQKPVVQRTIRQLTFLRHNAPKEIVPLLDDYIGLLLEYLERRSTVGSGGGRHLYVAAPVRILQRETIRKLDLLMVQKEALRRMLPAPSPETSGLSR